MTITKIRVILADDHAIFRQGLRALLQNEREMEIVAESSTGHGTVQLVEQHRPDVVVMDIGMPDMNGLQATTLIHSRFPDARVLILSMSGDEETVEQAIDAGISGYLVKDTVADELISAIREIHRGNAYFSPSISRILLEQKRNAPRARSDDGLTQREIQILQFVADGRTTKEIAHFLGISSKTVDNHRQQIMTKLNIHDMVSLTRYALSKGLVR